MSYPKTIAGLNNFFNSFYSRLKCLDLKRGCPIGNLILELSDENERFREHLLSWYHEVEKWIVEVLEINNIKNTVDKSKALIAAFEGTMLLAKLDKDSNHFDIFNKYTFNSIINC